MSSAFDQSLFSPEELPQPVAAEPKVKVIEWPIWTENKAKLIDSYLQLFVFITHHGTYIDGFAGPQKPNKPEMWSANLVLASEPKWLRHFYLFDIKPEQIERLKSLKDAQPLVDGKGKKIKREIEIFEGDFNVQLDGLLLRKCIGQKEATFCLLDQRTFECDWASVRKVASYKTLGDNKIEIFYFLAIGWLGRALSGLRDTSKLERWWGRGDYELLRAMNNFDRVQSFVSRFKDELGYKSVKAWPIRKRGSGGGIMYYMIHATDHAEAPVLMSRAYNNAVPPASEGDQLGLDFRF